MDNLYGVLPSYFNSEGELRQIWSDPITRKALLEQLAEAGCCVNLVGDTYFSIFCFLNSKIGCFKFQLTFSVRTWPRISPSANIFRRKPPDGKVHPVSISTS
uniref:Uncharacterized protein n=1 Tax=Candidatus Nitrotoga fabula TaxID=2182327 RepID=A0A2X0SIS8_9PROT|nr:protein of unknown function [Candidatus Nitrotoga fabula]